jgi:hypothetical protein
MIGENRVTGFEYNGALQLVQFNNRRWWTFEQVTKLLADGALDPFESWN